MKRIGHVFEKIVDIDNIRAAHAFASRGKAHYSEVRYVNENAEEVFAAIRAMLLSGEYKVSEYKKSVINDKGKERTLMKLPYYPDRIIQWAIMLQTEKVFLRTFTGFTCASIPNKGVHYALRKAKTALRRNPGLKYCLKMDVRKFYDSIDHGVLKRKLRAKFKDASLLRLLDAIIDSMPGGKGIPIGSYLSQYFANFYLSQMDHALKEKMGVKHIYRYMDDIVIMHRSKRFLHGIRRWVEGALGEMKLALKGNWQVFPIASRGIDFIGYRIFGGFVLLRKRICAGFKNSVGNVKSVASYLGWLKHCNAYRLRIKYAFA
jgi:hypothetical protein